MSNKMYLKGVRKERKLVNEARAKGLIAFRSAGSHSPIDVCIIDPKLQFIKFIQCKSDKLSNTAKAKLLDKHKELDTEFTVRFIVE